MILIAISTLIGFATFTLIVTANRRQIRRLKRRLDTQAKTMTALAELIRDGDEPEGPAEPPPTARHLHIVRDTAAVAVLALLLRRTAHAARAHPTLTAITVAAVGVAVTAAVLALPGAPRQPSLALPTATGLSSYPTSPASPPPSPALTPTSATGPVAPPRGTTTPRPSGTPPLPTTPPSSTGTGSTGTPQPSPTADTTPASSSPPATTPTTPSPTTSPPATTPTTTPSTSSTPGTPSSRPPAPPCLIALDVENLLELKLLCG